MAGFDSEKYERLQADLITQRADLLIDGGAAEGRLYLEVGGKLLYDDHASRVLPGFDPRCKIRILGRLMGLSPRIVLCISSVDLEKDRVWAQGETYQQSLLKLLDEYKQHLPKGIPDPDVVLNLLPKDQKAALSPKIQAVVDVLQQRGLKVWKRFVIEGYPNAPPSAFGELDDHLTWSDQVRVVIVTALGSNCGKMSTCLGQIYLDRTRLSLHSCYAKYELFPIYNLPVDHPIQLAYEAATADIGDFVEYDRFEEERPGQPRPVNYNRDNDAFPLLKRLLEVVSLEGEFSRDMYTSPTKMGMNAAGFCITDDLVCAAAAVEECKSRLRRYAAVGDEVGVSRTRDVIQRAEQSFERLKKKHGTHEASG